MKKLILLVSVILIANISFAQLPTHPAFQVVEGGIIRGSINEKKIALVFTGDTFNDGGDFIAKTLKQKKVLASFFLTGNFLREKSFEKTVRKLIANGNYLGVHSDQHLLYCDWNKRDSLLVSKEEFVTDLENAYTTLEHFGLGKKEAKYFLPPYEWYNNAISEWTREMGLQLVNFTPGSRSNADYTYPELGKQYLSSGAIFKHILDYEKKDPNGLNGFLLLVHIGTDPRRSDKFYLLLPQLIDALRQLNYSFVRVDTLLEQTK